MTAVGALVLASVFVQASDGAVFAIVPIVSPTDTGRVAGLVGAAGCVGGLLFPLAFGYGLELSGGSYLPGFIAVGMGGVVAICCVLGLRVEPEDEARAHGFALHDDDEAWERVPMTAAS